MQEENTKLPLTSGELETTSSQFIQQFKTVYYLLKGKRDTEIKLYTGYKEFSFEDIVNLNKKVEDYLKMHKVATSLVNVTVGFENKEITSYGNWDEFKINTDRNVPNITKYIVIEWSFNLLIPNHNIVTPQEHNIRVRIGNNLKPSEMIHVMFQGGEEHEYDELRSQMSCKIDFVHIQIAKGIKNLVTEWYDSLPTLEQDNKLIKYVIKYRGRISELITVVFLLVCVLLINMLFINFINKELPFYPSNQTHKVFFFYTLSVIFFYTFYRLANWLMQRIMHNISEIKRKHFFKITKGDDNRKQEINKENKQHLQNIFINIGVGLLVNAITAIISLLFSNPSPPTP